MITTNKKNKMKMNKRTFDMIIIAVIGLFLITLEFFGLTAEASKFMLIPILMFYYIGQYSERKFNK